MVKAIFPNLGRDVAKKKTKLALKQVHPVLLPFAPQRITQVFESFRAQNRSDKHEL